MQLAIFGDIDAKGFSDHGRSETVLVLFGNAKLDLTEHPLEPEASLTICAVFGSVQVIVPAGARLTRSGLSLFGSYRVKVRPGNGPVLRIRGFALFGSLTITEGPSLPVLPGREAIDIRFFPDSDREVRIKKTETEVRKER